MPDQSHDPPQRAPAFRESAGTVPASDKTSAMRSTNLDFMLYLVIPFLIPVGFAFAVGALWARLKSLRAARDPCARNYWRCSVTAHLLFAYAVLVLSLLAMDNVLGEPWGLLEWWPSLARLWYAEGNALVPVLLDVAGVLALALVALAAAHYFGHVDEANVWHPPRRLLAARNRLQDGC